MTARRGIAAKWGRCGACAVLALAMSFLGGCSNLPAAEPGTLAADPGLQFLTPSLELEDAELGPGDEIRISVYRHPDLNRTVEIPASGIIVLPLAGEVDARSASVGMIRERVTVAYADYVVDPDVTVEVTVRRSQRVLVLGEVRRAGVFTIARPTSTLDVIAQSGGFTRAGAMNAVYLHRLEDGRPVQRVLDMDRLLTYGAFENNPMIQAGDILYVPPSEFAKADRFAQHVSTWLTPVLLTQDAILRTQAIREDVFKDGIGGSSSSSGIIIVPGTPTAP